MQSAMNKNTFYPIIFSIFYFFFQNFNVVTTCGFFTCYKIILLSFIHKIQISTNYEKIIIKFVVHSIALATVCTILPIVR